MPTYFRDGHGWLCDASDLSRGIDLVGENVIVESLGDRLVEAGEQLGQGLAPVAHQHCQGVVLVGGHGDAADGYISPRVISP